MTDFTIMVDNIPPDVTEEEISTHFCRILNRKVAEVRERQHPSEALEARCLDFTVTTAKHINSSAWMSSRWHFKGKWLGARQPRSRASTNELFEDSKLRSVSNQNVGRKPVKNLDRVGRRLRY